MIFLPKVYTKNWSSFQRNILCSAGVHLLHFDFIHLIHFHFHSLSIHSLISYHHFIWLIFIFHITFVHTRDSCFFDFIFIWPIVTSCHFIDSQSQNFSFLISTFFTFFTHYLISFDSHLHFSHHICSHQGQLFLVILCSLLLFSLVLDWSTALLVSCRDQSNWLATIQVPTKLGTHKVGNIKGLNG